MLHMLKHIDNKKWQKKKYTKLYSLFCYRSHFNFSYICSSAFCFFIILKRVAINQGIIFHTHTPNEPTTITSVITTTTSSSSSFTYNVIIDNDNDKIPHKERIIWHSNNHCMCMLYKVYYPLQKNGCNMMFLACNFFIFSS